MRHVALGVILLVMMACAANTVTSWEGKHRDALVRAWGPPDKTAQLSEGGTRLIYLQGVVAKSMDYMCQMVFDSDREGIIRSEWYYGCP